MAGKWVRDIFSAKTATPRKGHPAAPPQARIAPPMTAAQNAGGVTVLRRPTAAEPDLDEAIPPTLTTLPPRAPLYVASSERTDASRGPRLATGWTHQCRFGLGSGLRHHST
jgi:hypothetical protein